jgi:hypothetical protein
MIIWSISLWMGKGRGRVLSLSGRGAIPVLWIGVIEPVMVRLLSNSCLTLTDMEVAEQYLSSYYTIMKESNEVRNVLGIDEKRKISNEL